MAAKRDYELAAAIYPDPRKLLEKDEWYYESPFRPYRGVVSGFLFGLCWKVTHNLAHRRPLRAGIHMYVGYGMAFSVVGHLISKGLLGYFSYRDRISRHYIATHPDDFPPPPKIKVGENWEPWVPIR